EAVEPTSAPAYSTWPLPSPLPGYPITASAPPCVFRPQTGQEGRPMQHPGVAVGGERHPLARKRPIEMALHLHFINGGRKGQAPCGVALEVGRLDVHDRPRPRSPAVERLPDADALLLEQIRSADAEAGQRFVREHYSAIYRYLLYLTGRRDLAEDLTQETFL